MKIPHDLRDTQNVQKVSYYLMILLEIKVNKHIKLWNVAQYWYYVIKYIFSH